MSAIDTERRSEPRLLGVGTALPAMRRSQAEVCEEIGVMLGLAGGERALWQRIWKGSGIEHRHAVAPLSDVVGLSTAARMRLFDPHATALAADAARAALLDAGVDAAQVTDLIVVTCTGFSAPGVPRRLIDQLGLAPSVRSSQIGFMGCFGGVCGLRAAAAHASADARGVVLMVSVELCSLHMRLDRDPQNMVATALFADGAAAVVVACHHPSRNAAEATPRLSGSSCPIIRPGRSLTVPDTLDAMSWIITDAGFAMTLAREVPEAIARGLPGLIGTTHEAIVHPGGPSIIDAVVASLAPSQLGAIDHSRGVLRDCGNLSSATILFVLERWRRSGGSRPAAMVAFGPGLTIDLVTLETP